MLEFLKDNWRLIVEVVLLIVSVVILICRKKPTSDIRTLVFEWCLEAINIAEKSGVKGSEKLAVAVQYVNNCLKIHFPDIKLSNYTGGIVSIIEDILATPQRKGK